MESSPMLTLQTDARICRPEADRAGGAQLVDLTGERVRIEGDSLRALDLLDAPRLEYLDLSACRPGLFLALARCPRLQRIDLPQGDAGAIIHWDRHAVAGTEAVIHGPVEHLDLCGRGYAFGLPGGRADPRAWQGARITSSLVHFIAAGEEALVWLGAESSFAVPQLSIPQQARSAYIHGLGVAAVQVRDGAALQYLALDQAADLQQVSSATPLRGLTIERAERLEQVHAEGEAVQLKHCGDLEGGVYLRGSWQHALLDDTALSEESGPQIEQVVARGGRRGPVNSQQGRLRPWLSKQRRAPPQPSEVPLLLEAAQAGERRAGDTLISWAESVSRRNVLFALQTLYSLIECPEAAAERIWRARESLARRFRSHHAGNSEWAWNLPEDLLEETLCTDFRIFSRCRGRVAGTQGLDVHLRNTPRSREMRILASIAGDRQLPGEERWLAEELLRELLGVAASEAVGQPRGPGHMGPPSDLGPLLRWIIERCERQLADDLLAWLNRAVRVDRRVRYLAELAIHGHAPSRSAAMAIGLGASPSAQSRHQERGAGQAVRQRAMAAALAPARSERLADSRPEAGEEERQ